MASFLRDITRLVAVLLACWVLATASIEAIRTIAALALTIWPNFGGW